MKPDATKVTITNKFRTLFDNTPEIILYQNKDSIILDANPAFLKLVCEPKEKVINQNFHDFLPDKVRSLFAEKLSEAFTGKTVRFEMYFAYKNNVAVHWDVVKIPLIKDKKVCGIYMIARDVTEKIEAQEKIFRQNKDLQQFTYMVAHNLHGPLSNAMGLVDIIGTLELNSSLFGDTHVHLKNSLQQLDRVMKDMNTILSIRHQEIPSEAGDWSSIGKAVGRVLLNLQGEIDQCSGTVKILIPTDFTVRANQAFLDSVLFNLISNSIKYRHELRPLFVELSAIEKADRSKVITISDNGLGIDLEKAGHNMFKPYKRFHPQHPGHGLGLYMVKTQLEGMGGHIQVSSQPDQGTVFTIILP